MTKDKAPVTPAVRALRAARVAFSDHLWPNLLDAVAWMDRFCDSNRDGLIDYQGRPLGTDFSNVYTAGRMALEGHAAEVPARAARSRVVARRLGRCPGYSRHIRPQRRDRIRRTHRPRADSGRAEEPCLRQGGKIR